MQRISSYEYLGLTIRYYAVKRGILFRCVERTGEFVCKGIADTHLDVRRQINRAIKEDAA